MEANRGVFIFKVFGGGLGAFGLVLFLLACSGLGGAGQGDVVLTRTDPNNTRVEPARYVSEGDILLGRLAPFAAGGGIASMFVGMFLLGVKPVDEEDDDQRGISLGAEVTQIQDPQTLLQPTVLPRAEETVHSVPRTAPRMPIQSPSVQGQPVVEAELQALYGSSPSPEDIYAAIRINEQPKPEPQVMGSSPSLIKEPLSEDEELGLGEDESLLVPSDVWDSGDFEVAETSLPLYSEEKSIADLLVDAIKNQTNVILAAKTRSGKSTLFQNAIYKAINEFGGAEQYGKNIMFSVVDPKGNTWCGLEYKKDQLTLAFNKDIRPESLPASFRSCVLRVVEDSDMQYVINRLKAIKNLLAVRIKVRQKIALSQDQYKNYGGAELLKKIQELKSHPTMNFVCVIILDEHLSLLQKAENADKMAKAGRPAPPNCPDWGNMKALYEDLSGHIARTGGQDRILIWRVVHSLRVGQNFKSGEEKEQCLNLALGRKGKSETLDDMIQQVSRIDPNTANLLRDSLNKRLALKQHESIPLAIAPVGHSPGESYGLWTAEDLSSHYNSDIRAIQLNLFPPPRPR